MSAFEVSRGSGAESEIEDEQIDVDSDPTPIDIDRHRCQHHHQQQQQQRHRHGDLLQQPSCIQLRLPYADRPRLEPSTKPEDRLRKRSDDRVGAQSALPLHHVNCSTTTELQSLLSRTSDADPISSSDKRLLRSPPSAIDRSSSSGASSSSSSSSSSVSSPPSSPPHQKHQRLSIVPSLDTPFSLGLNKSDDVYQQQRRPSCPPSGAGGAVIPRSAPAPVTNFFIEEILKASFGVSPKPMGFRTAWGKGSVVPCERLQDVSPEPLIRSELPTRPLLPSQNDYVHFPIIRVSVQEPGEASSIRNHVIKRRNQSKPSQNSDRSDIRKVDLEKDYGKLPSTKIILNVNAKNKGLDSFIDQSPNNRSSSRYPASPFVESRVFKQVTCSNASAANDCSNSNSSSSASSHSSGSLPEDSRKSEESDQRLHPSDPGSASSGSSNYFQSQQLPAWVFCTRYSDRPSSGPRSRKVRPRADTTVDDKRPRTAFTNDQLQILKREFSANQYLNEDRRHALATKLNLNETQIKIWFQNKRAKLKKASGTRNRLALELMAQGLYNHSTVTANGECI